MIRWIWILLGSIFVVAGFVGLFLPIVPTVPFLLMALYCFSKGSKKLHHWLLNHPKFGPLIRAWNEHGVIRPRSKVLATLTILISFSFPVFFLPLHPTVRVVSALGCMALLAFILSRKSRV
jgi:uncharacterized protein